MSEIYHANDAAIDGELSFLLECDKMKSILRRTMLEIGRASCRERV